MLKEIYRRIRYREKSSSEQYIRYLRKKGCIIGDNCRIFDPISNIIDIQNPYMITIGNNVRITSNVVILTHDYSWSVLTAVKGEVLGGIGEVTIGNNVFIGMNSIILKNTIIGDNVIIGAGSIVSGKIEKNSVYAGNPAKKIMGIEEFYQKRKKKQLEEVITIVKNIEVRNKRRPNKRELLEYFWLYESDTLNMDEINLIKRTGEEEYILNKLKNKEIQFNSFEEMIEYCENKIEERNKIT